MVTPKFRIPKLRCADSPLIGTFRFVTQISKHVYCKMDNTRYKLVNCLGIKRLNTENVF